MIAQEEMKEAFLAYALCTAAAEPPGSKAELDRRVEAYLCERFAARLDFDHTDALETLGRLGLWADPPALQVIAPAVAIERLRDHACARRSIGYHDDCASREETLASAKTGPPEGAPRAETGGDERYGSSLPEMTAASHNSSASA
jgi:hypothetical protein